MQIRYVTYDQDGNLTGCYIQELQPEHENCYLLFPENPPLPWVYYRANADRTDVELIPVDPVPDEPVESDPPQP